MARGTVVTRTLKDGKTKRYHAAIWVSTPDGGKKQQWKTFEKKRDAENFLDDRSREVRVGDYIEPKKILFTRFADEWLEKYPRLAEQGPLKPSTVYGYERVIEGHLRPFFGEMLIGNIHAVVIEKDFKSQLPESTGPTTVRNILQVLRKMLQTGVDWGYISRNPFDKRGGTVSVRLPKKNKRQMGRALTPVEIRTLLDNCFNDAYPIVATAILTGVRRSELFGLRWEDVDFEQNKVHIRQALFFRRGYEVTFNAPKSIQSHRSIDMSPRLRKILLEHRLVAKANENQFGLVFTNRKGLPVDPNNFVKRRFLTAVTAAELGHLRWHDLRHTFGSLKIEQGENIKYVQTQMGHSSVMVTLDVYGHLLEDSNPEAANKTDQLLFGAI